MKKNDVTGNLIKVIIVAAFLCPAIAMSQDLTEVQKQERCQNNKDRIAELEAQIRIVNAELSNTMTKQEMEDTRIEMVSVRALRSSLASTQYMQGGLDRIATRYNVDCKFDDQFIDLLGKIYCLRELERVIAEKIDKAVALNRPQLLNKKTEMEKQLNNHRTNLIALGCDAKTSTGGTLHLVGPELLGKNRKDSYNAVVYSEYTFTPTTAELTIQNDPPDKKVIKWEFSGIPAGSLSPGDSITISISGSLEMHVPGDLQPYPSASIRTTGFTVVSAESAYVGVNAKRNGKYVLKLLPGAKSCTIEIGADYGLGTFARYRYEK